MRELFTSEKRYIQNILWKKAKIRLENNVVVAEYYAPPRSPTGVRFNTDYFLQFVPDDERKHIKTKSYCVNVLPNTVGVDVFVTIDEQSSQLVMTELLGGEAFPMKYFKEHIENIENRLARLSHPIDLRRSSYCRIFVIENDICFLAFPNHTMPVVRGEREPLCADAESLIVCSKEAGNIVYLDGWIQTYVAESNRKLEAICAKVATESKKMQ